jgi:hypothetical protein
MPDLDHLNEQPVIVDLIQDAVVTNPYPQDAWFAG